MQTLTAIGLDIAKSGFQAHGVDAGGQVIVRRQLKHRYFLTFFQKLSPCLVGHALRIAARVRVLAATRRKARLIDDFCRFEALPPQAR